MSFLGTAKDAYELAKKGMTIELQEKIMELREGALSLQEENLQLRQRVTELEQKLVTDSTIEYRKPFYIKSGDDHPFCPVCWEKDKSLIHLKGPDGDPEWFKCPVCKWQEALHPEKIQPYVPISRGRDRRITL